MTEERGAARVVSQVLVNWYLLDMQAHAEDVGQDPVV
ncbi:uncharacterized protein METZ01_LOCUS345502, partial [marine metagenome]